MNDYYQRILNPNDTLDKSIPKIIEAFVSFYGEEEREDITRKFYNLKAIGYGLTDNLDYFINSIKTLIGEQLVLEFVKHFSEPDEMRKIFFAEYGFDFSSLMPFNYYFEHLNNMKKNDVRSYTKEQALEFLKKFNSGVTLENMDSLISNGAFSELDKIIPKYQEYIQKYEDEIEKLSSFTLQANKTKELKEKLRRKYFHQLIDEFAYLFSKEDIFEAKNSFYPKNPVIAYLGNNIDITGLLDAFSNESEEEIKNNGWRCSSYLSDRVSFYKMMGIDLGDDYESYENNPSILNITPSKELVERILSRKKELEEKMLIEFYESSIEYVNNREMIDRLGLLDKDDGYDANHYANHLTCVTPNIKMVDGEVIAFPLVFISVGVMNEYLDAKIIHEFNHVYELNLRKYNEEEVEFSSGWDIVSDSFKEVSTKTIKDCKDIRQYELFNEIINEMIAQEITTLMHENNVYLFNDKDNAKVSGGTSYESTMFLVRDFYNEFKEEILLTRKKRDMAPLFEKVGEDNFNALNDLFSVFDEHFSGMKYYSLMSDLHNEKETENVRIFTDIVQKRNVILENMRTYAKTK